MDAPPGPAYLILGGIGWNLGRSLRNRLRRRRGLPTRTVVSRWACRNKKIAVPVAVAGGTWLAVHFALYVIELPD